jgi:hypothetical protein
MKVSKEKDEQENEFKKLSEEEIEKLNSDVNKSVEKCN